MNAQGATEIPAWFCSDDGSKRCVCANAGWVYAPDVAGGSCVSAEYAEALTVNNNNQVAATARTAGAEAGDGEGSRLIGLNGTNLTDDSLSGATSAQSSAGDGSQKTSGSLGNAPS